MKLKINTYILKGLDNKQTKLLDSTIDYISSIQNIENNISIIDNLNIKLSGNDFLIILIDGLLLEQIIQNNKNKEFFLKKEFHNNQIILILDDININTLPEYMQYFQTFSLINSESFIDDEDEEWNDDAKETKTKLIEITNDIVHYILRVKNGTKKKALTIYVGPADGNTTAEYQKITRELLHRNFNLLPEISNPTAKELIDNRNVFLDMLNSSDLSIHFISHKSLLNYPEKKSSAFKINNIAAEFCGTEKGKLLQRIIYVPSEKTEVDELLDKKILQFKSNTKSLLNAELIQTPVEKLKEVVLEKLNELSKPTTKRNKTNEIIDEVYLIYPTGKDKDVQPYITWFEKNKIAYSKSQIKLDQLELLNYHQQKLTTCKAVIIYNTGNNQWLNRKLSDIKKSLGWGRKEQFSYKAICGVTPDKNILENNNLETFFIIEKTSYLDKTKLKELKNIIKVTSSAKTNIT